MRSNNKRNFIINNNEIDKLILKLNEIYGLPEITSSIAIYHTEKNKTLEIKFQNSECYLRSYDKSSNYDKQIIEIFNDTPPIKIENQNIKYLLRILNGFEITKAHISDEVIQLKYCKVNETPQSIISINTPVGCLFTTYGDLPKNLTFLRDNKISKEITVDDIDHKFESFEKENIFGPSRRLNSKLIQYGNKYGLDLTSSGISNLDLRISNKSNDYSHLEKYYEKITGMGLNSERKSESLPSKLFKPLSIVIPAYNADSSLLLVLQSIERQNLNKRQLEKIDIIIVDDGSTIPVSDLISDFIKKTVLKINLVRLEKCQGVANARNLGASISKCNHIIFMDADILLSKNYLLEHSVALQMFPDTLFVSMKNNIDDTSEIETKLNADGGLEPPVMYNDKRILRIFEENQDWINQVKVDGISETLGDTDLFKSFGYGRIINGYDLPSVVTGHNMSMSYDLYKRAGGFSNNFIGWGLEDTYFGARVIATGGFIIPLTHTGVYHINHPPRSGNEEKRQEEYKKNLDIYKNLLKETV